MDCGAKRPRLLKHGAIPKLFRRNLGYARIRPNGRQRKILDYGHRAGLRHGGIGSVLIVWVPVLKAKLWNRMRSPLGLIIGWGIGLSFIVWCLL